MIPAPNRARPATSAAVVNEAGTRSIPFDYVFRFNLTGTADKTHRQTVTVGVEASFTAASIGYGVVPEVEPVFFGPPPAAPLALAVPALVARVVPIVPPGFLSAITTSFPALSAPLAAPPPVTLRDITLGELLPTLETAIGNAPNVPRDMPALEAALRNGIKLNPAVARVALAGNGQAVLDRSVLRSLFQVVSAPVADVQFLYALFDEGSGREFQSDPILNVAGLGAADGKRPFRYFAQPITFAPLATIRMDITEKSTFRGELHVSLHGYRILGGPPAPSDPQRRRPRRPSR